MPSDRPDVLDLVTTGDLDEGRVLLALAEQYGGCARLTTLVERAGLGFARTVAVLDRLVAEKLVLQTDDPMLYALALDRPAPHWLIIHVRGRPWLQMIVLGSAGTPWPVAAPAPRSKPKRFFRLRPFWSRSVASVLSALSPAGR